MRTQIFLLFCLLLCTQIYRARGGKHDERLWARINARIREREEQRIMDSQTIAERFPPPKPVYKANPYGQVQYSAYSRPTHSYGKYSAGGSSYGYRAPGYGTNWGTSFPAGVGSYKGELSSKALGLGVGPGFFGGSAGARLGVAATMATYAVYHRLEGAGVRLLQNMYKGHYYFQTDIFMVHPLLTPIKLTFF